MSFLAPLYLLLGAAAAVPLLLHLLRRHVTTQVDFPAARYLQRAEQEHSRSLRLRNLLLMLLRVLLILAVALAAAQPFIAGLGVGHGPTAVAVVLDNSLSTTAVANGAPVFTTLRDAARSLVAAATPADRVWLVTADGRVRGGSRESVLSGLARVTAQQGAGDLPLALRRAAAAVQGSALPARVVAVATDAQRSGWQGARRVDVPVSVLAPAGAPPRNRAVLSLTVDPPHWTPGGAVAARIDSPDSVGYRMVLGDRTLARGAAAPGVPVQLRVTPPERGWQSLRLELEPDDFTADDARFAAVWIGPAPGIAIDPSSGPFVSTAMSALIADGRAAAGHDVRVASADVAAALPALLTPPIDAVRLGAANRNLARLGIPWRYGPVETSPAIVHGGRLEGIAVAWRYRLLRADASAGDTLATAAGEPWIVAGPGYVLLASRLDPTATTLPLRAAFVPWLADMVGLRLGAPAGDAGAPIRAAPGAPIRLPDGADAIEGAGGTRRSVTGPDARAPDERGVWFILRAGHRVGAIEVNAPPAESRLARWSADALAARLGPARSRSAESAGPWARETFAAGTRRPITTPLLILALLLIAAEAIAVRTTRSLAA